MDDLTRHRKKRLQALIDAQPFEGSRSSFAKRAGLSKGRISQLLSPDEAFGEGSAMKLAAALGFRDDRYFERPFPGETGAPVVVDERAEVDALEALKVLAGVLGAADKATRRAVAPLLRHLPAFPPGRSSPRPSRRRRTAAAPHIPLLVMLAFSGAACAAHPLEDATYEAMKLCGVVHALTLESCGDSALRSPEHTAARKAVGRMYSAQAAFMRSCQKEDSPSACTYRADWLFWGGFNRAMDEEAQAKRTSAP